MKNSADSQIIADATLVWTEKGLEIFARPSNGTAIDVEFDEVDLAAITKTQAIGGYDTATMKRTGLELLDEVFLNYSELPSFVDVPDFSHESDVAAVMATKAKNINGGIFESVALINAPIDKRYDEISKWKDDKNILDNDQIILYGQLKLGGNKYYQSLHYGALSMSVDNQGDGIPSQSPSNFAYKCDSLVWKNSKGDFEEIRLDLNQQANYLNQNGAITAVNFKGWRCWGTETAKNPMATDPKDKFTYIRRMFKYIGNELVMSYFNSIDKRFTYKMAETITKSMNIRLNALSSMQHLLEARAEFSAEDDGLLNVINGDITWIIYLGIVPGMKSATFKKKYDVDALQKLAGSLTK